MKNRSLFRYAGIAAFLGFTAALVACGTDYQARPGASGSSANLAVDLSGPDPAAADAATERKVVITSTVELTVEDLAAAYTRVQSIARAAGGFVAESSRQGDGGGRRAVLRLRVPAAEHDAVVAAVRALGLDIVSESTNAREVTEEYTDLDARLRNFQRSEAQYQQFLAQARTIDEVLNVSTRLDSVRGEIEQLQGRLRFLDNTSDFATINVSLSLPPAKTTRPGPLEVFVEAWDLSLDAALIGLNLMAASLVLMVWLLLLAPVGLLGLRFGRRLAPVARRIMEG